jgi:hypothetical protein
MISLEGFVNASPVGCSMTWKPQANPPARPSVVDANGTPLSATGISGVRQPGLMSAYREFELSVVTVLAVTA